MNTEDSEFERIEREQAMRGVPDAIHHTDTSETLEYITGWNDCRQAMLAEQPAQQCKWPTCQSEEAQQALAEQIKRELVGEQPAPMLQPNRVISYAAAMKLRELGYKWMNDEWKHLYELAEQPAQQEPVAWWDAKLGVFNEKHFDQLQPLYTSPPAQRKPLNVAEVEQILAQHNYEIHGDRARYIVRMTEAAHGIKENP